MENKNNSNAEDMVITALLIFVVFGIVIVGGSDLDSETNAEATSTPAPTAVVTTPTPVPASTPAVEVRKKSGKQKKLVSSTKVPFFYVSKKGVLTFNKKVGKFGEFEEKEEDYVSWFAHKSTKKPLPDMLIKSSFKFTSKKDVKAFSKYLFGKKMKTKKIGKLDSLPKLKGKKYIIRWIDYTYCKDNDENQIMISLVSKKDDFTIIYKLNDKFNIAEIHYIYNSLYI